MSRDKKQVRRAFREAVFRRDGYCCRGCGFRSTPYRAEEDLDAHHITDRNEMPNGGYVVENGISLCETCHIRAEAHHRGELIPEGFAPADLYRRVGSSEAAARAAASRG